MRKHGMSDKKQIDNYNNVQFARELFDIIDDNQSGGLYVSELSVPLISLGLSSDGSFIEKVLRAINPKKFENNFDEELTLKEFIKIFKKD